MNWGEVKLLNAGGARKLATADSGKRRGWPQRSAAWSSLRAEHTSIEVDAPAAESTSTGNYVPSAYNVTPNVFPLVVNQQETGTIQNPFGRGPLDVQRRRQ